MYQLGGGYVDCMYKLGGGYVDCMYKLGGGYVDYWLNIIECLATLGGAYKSLCIILSKIYVKATLRDMCHLNVRLTEIDQW